jgi:hypothetical protein
LCELMHQARVRSHTKKNIQSGFKASGIWPFNPNWVADNKEKLDISTFFSTEAESDKVAAAAAQVAYINLVSDFGPRDALLAHHAVTHSPYTDPPTGFTQMAALAAQTDKCTVSAFTRRAVGRVMKKPKPRTRDRAQRIRTNLINESHSAAKHLNEPDRTAELFEVREEQAEKRAEQEERAEVRQVQAAAEVFLLQSLKKLKFALPEKKTVTVADMTAFLKKNPASDIQFKKLKARPAFVEACRKHIGRPHSGGLVAADDSKLELTIPTGHEWVEPAAAEAEGPAAAGAEEPAAAEAEEPAAAEVEEPAHT